MRGRVRERVRVRVRVKYPKKRILISDKNGYEREG